VRNIENDLGDEFEIWGNPKLSGLYLVNDRGRTRYEEDYCDKIADFNFDFMILFNFEEFIKYQRKYINFDDKEELEFLFGSIIERLKFFEELSIAKRVSSIVYDYFTKKTKYLAMVPELDQETIIKKEKPQLDLPTTIIDRVEGDPFSVEQSQEPADWLPC
jgi:hypothetical protein